MKRPELVEKLEPIPITLEAGDYWQLSALGKALELAQVAAAQHVQRAKAEHVRLLVALSNKYDGLGAEDAVYTMDDKALTLTLTPTPAGPETCKT